MPAFGADSYEALALAQANEAEQQLKRRDVEGAQVHASLAIAYAQLADMAVRAARGR